MKSLRTLPAATAAALVVMAGAPLHAQTTPCEAIFEPRLAEGIAATHARLRRDWRILDEAWVTTYTIEPARQSPFDPDRLGGAADGARPAAGPAERASDPAPKRGPGGRDARPAPAVTIVGHVSARDVRCNASAAAAADAVTVVYSAAAMRFQEAPGPWSAALPDATLAAFVLLRSRDGWTLLDRTADRGVLPPDARLSAPADGVARTLATKPWQRSRRPRRTRRAQAIRNPQARRSSTRPQTIRAAPASRALPSLSPSSSVPSSAANSTEVSRAALTAAIGARVIAHRAMP